MNIKDCLSFKNVPNMGYIYYFKVGNNQLKIGQTGNLATRMKTHSRDMGKFDYDITDVCLSKPHTNYISNEKQLFKLLNKYRVNEYELFNCDLNTVKDSLDLLSYENKKKFNKLSIDRNQSSCYMLTYNSICQEIPCRSDGFISLTNINKHFPNRQLSKWRSSDRTSIFIDLVTRKLGKPSLISLRGKYNSGTYAHIDVALKFCMWLNPELDLEVIETFSNQPTGYRL